MPRHGRKDGGDGGFQQPHDVAETDGKGRMGTSDPNLLWAINSGGHVAPVAVQRTSGFSLQLSTLSGLERGAYFLLKQARFPRDPRNDDRG